ncbi:MAG TPA: GNAT family N-acetyltransferase [Thermoanaerobaculia bacterium]|nr:GNAT family N-acetyltransferase [Thermoanaerobaculia bacterium]
MGLKPPEPAILRVGKRVYLRRPHLDDSREFLALMKASRKLHHPWVQPPTDRTAFAHYVERTCSDRCVGSLICLREDEAIVGVANLSEIARGLFQSCYLGFYGSAPYLGQGLMREGVELMLRYAFRDLKLHRIEANVQPGNLRSLALVKALGFKKEGFSPRYLKIAGRWRDHERWTRLADG